MTLPVLNTETAQGVCSDCEHWVSWVVNKYQPSTIVHCRAKGNKSCCDQVSLLSGKCPKDKWQSEWFHEYSGGRALKRNPVFVHVGFADQARGFASRSATKMGMSYFFSSVQEEFFKSASTLKKASFALIWNGMQHYAPHAVRFCIQRGIPFLIYEWGWQPQNETFIVDPCGLVGDSILNTNLGWITEEDMQTMLQARKELQEKHPIEPVKNRLLLLLQIHNDTQILFHSPFSSMVGVVEATRLLYPNHDIVVRPHPKSGAFPRIKRLNYSVDASGKLLDQARKAELVVAVNSTGLYESALLGVPVKALGNCPLSSYSTQVDRVLAGMWALRLKRTEGDVAGLVKRFRLLEAQ